MKRAVLVAFLCAVVLAIAAPPHGSSAAGFSGSGSGTAGDPYMITTVGQLQEMENSLTAHYALGNDIDASGTVNWNGGAGFEPVGTKASMFTGSLDGRGYRITDLYIDRSGTDNVGLFGYVGSGGVVENVELENENVRGSWFTGGLVGVNWGIISNSYSTGPVSGNGDVGGLVGYNGGTVSNNYSTGAVVGDNYVGGLVGNNWGIVSNSFWDTQTSGQATSNGGTGKITENMKNVRTYTDLAWSGGLSSAWDFVGNPYDDTRNGDIWGINPDVNDGYPFLMGVTPAAVPPEEFPWGLVIGIIAAIVIAIVIVALLYKRRH